MMIHIPDSKIDKLAKDIANYLEEGYDNDFKYTVQGILQFKKQIKKGIKETLSDYILTVDHFLDNGLIDLRSKDGDTKQLK